MAPSRPRIALVAFRLESNFHAPVCGAEEFDRLGGPALLADLATDAPRAPLEFSGFMAAMAETGGFEPVPLAVAAGGAAGPVDQAYLDAFMAEVADRLRAAGPVDGVYFAEHGAAIATEDEDPDGTLFARVRALVGPDVPVVATLDLHANVGERMVEATDVLVSYRTNPHVDAFARGEEAARAMRELLAGVRATTAFRKLPLIPPSIAQNTKDGPYGDHIRFGQGFVDDTVLSVSVVAGFSLGDTVKNGMAVVVTTRGDRDRAEAVADAVAARIWAERHRYDVTLTPLADAVAMMQARDADPALPSLCFADVADNPGGGGRGNTMFILEAFLAAGCRDVLLGPVFDAPLAATAHRLGAGARFEATFNREETQAFSKPLTWPAEVVRLHDGVMVGRRGIRAGRTLDLGPTAVLRLDGVHVLVTSRRFQFCDPVMAEAVGFPLDSLRGLVVKSRGHFRAAVDEVFDDDRIVEVDVPGLTTPVLSRVPFARVPRPIYPLDPETTWPPTGERDAAG
jgi:microcystin degradation protein MlrC